MNYIFLIVIIISLWGCRLRKDNCEGYLSPAQTSAVNGIFVMLIFLRHFSLTIDVSSVHDSLYATIDAYLGQVIVTTFMFYSGYGIMYSIKHKDNYIFSLPKRFLKVLIQFDLAVVLFLITNYFIGTELFSFERIFFSLLGWKAVGNSCWYIFAMLCLYIITFLAGIIGKKNHLLLIILVVIGCCMYAALTKVADKRTYWYDTVFCFPAGMLYAHYFDKIQSILTKGKNKFIFFGSSLLLFFAFFYLEKHSSSVVWLGSLVLRNLFFALVMVSFTVIFKQGNCILDWLGKYVFEIFILQNLPMLVFVDIIKNRYIYFVVCLVVTLVLAVLFKPLTKWATSFLNKSSSKKVIENRA